jgi:hypothetical protein
VYSVEINGNVVPEAAYETAAGAPSDAESAASNAYSCHAPKVADTDYILLELEPTVQGAGLSAAQKSLLEERKVELLEYQGNYLVRRPASGAIG